MAKRRELTDFERGLIVGARRMGRSITEVVLAFNFPRSTVSRVYREYLAGITSHGGQRSGRPRMLNDEDLKRLDSIVCANRYATLDEITATFNAGALSAHENQACLTNFSRDYPLHTGNTP
uniref:Tc3 transposase DNA binding domain-containing protein n=1 Tax=Astyanax mexicanus TaxID=7994 RepID=A0A3B1K5D6_ASTMX